MYLECAGLLEHGDLLALFRFFAGFGRGGFGDVSWVNGGRRCRDGGLAGRTRRSRRVTLCDGTNGCRSIGLRKRVGRRTSARGGGRQRSRRETRRGDGHTSDRRDDGLQQRVGWSRGGGGGARRRRRRTRTGRGSRRVTRGRDNRKIGRNAHGLRQRGAPANRLPSSRRVTQGFDGHACDGFPRGLRERVVGRCPRLQQPGEWHREGLLLLLRHGGRALGLATVSAATPWHAFRVPETHRCIRVKRVSDLIL